MKRPDPVEIVAIAVPVLVEAVAVTLFLAGCLVCLILLKVPA